MNRYWPVTVKKLSGKRMDQINLLIPAPLPDNCRAAQIQYLEDWTMNAESHTGKSDQSRAMEHQKAVRFSNGKHRQNSNTSPLPAQEISLLEI